MMFIESVKKINNILEESIKKHVFGKKIAISFSGGLDSGVLSLISEKHSDKIVYYTAGVENCYDINNASYFLEEIGVKKRHKIIIIDEIFVKKELNNIKKIMGIEDIFTISFEIPLYYVLKNCEEEVVLSGQGADELFLGFFKYNCKKYEKEELELMLNEDFLKLKKVLEVEERMANYFGKKIYYPYLEYGIIEERNKLMEKDLFFNINKKLLRELAILNGNKRLSEIKKKATQYGSGSYKILKKIGNG